MVLGEECWRGERRGRGKREMDRGGMEWVLERVLRRGGGCCRDGRGRGEEGELELG